VEMEVEIGRIFKVYLDFIIGLNDTTYQENLIPFLFSG
jgi:hypothetical protein